MTRWQQAPTRLHFYSFRQHEPNASNWRLWMTLMFSEMHSETAVMIICSSMLSHPNPLPRCLLRRPEMWRVALMCTQRFVKRAAWASRNADFFSSAINSGHEAPPLLAMTVFNLSHICCTLRLLLKRIRQRRTLRLKMKPTPNLNSFRAPKCWTSPEHMFWEQIQIPKCIGQHQHQAWYKSVPHPLGHLSWLGSPGSFVKIAPSPERSSSASSRARSSESNNLVPWGKTWLAWKMASVFFFIYTTV